MLPNLIHAIPVEIEPIDKGSTFFDNDARERIRTIASSTTRNLSAQVSYTSKDDPTLLKMGVSEESRGYLLFLQTNLNGTPLKRGDKIIKIGLDSVEFYITELRPAGHYPDQGGATLMMAFFQDRSPRE